VAAAAANEVVAYFPSEAVGAVAAAKEEVGVYYS
jgi:hypothetical protein